MRNWVSIKTFTDIKFEFFDIENPVKYLNFKITDIEDIEEGKEELINA